MKHFCAGIVLAIALSTTSAIAAGPYDGTWVGEANGVNSSGARGGSGVCTAAISATVAGNSVKGKVAFARETRPLNGTIGADGSFTGTVGPLAVTGKFAGATFQGDFTTTGNCGQFRFNLKRS